MSAVSAGGKPLVRTEGELEYLVKTCTAGGYSKGAVRAGRQMNPFTQQRGDVPEIEFQHRQVSLPSSHVERAEIVEHRTGLTAALYPQLPFPPVIFDRLGFGVSTTP